MVPPPLSPKLCLRCTCSQMNGDGPAQLPPLVGLLSTSWEQGVWHPGGMGQVHGGEGGAHRSALLLPVGSQVSYHRMDQQGPQLLPVGSLLRGGRPKQTLTCPWRHTGWAQRGPVHCGMSHSNLGPSP